MRTTLDIDDDVLQAAKERAARDRKTAGEVISERAKAWLSVTRTGLDFLPDHANRLRAMWHRSYANAMPVPAVIERLSMACQSELHQFWPDDISVLAANVFDSVGLHGPLQLTDVYLLALACRHGGRLVTFDTSIPRAAAIGARAENIVVL